MSANRVNSSANGDRTLEELRTLESSWAHIRLAMEEVLGEERSRHCNNATISTVFVPFCQIFNPYGLGKLGNLNTSPKDDN